jgi:hypothetical protein
VSDKGLITRIYRELKKLTPQRINSPLNKWANELNTQFSKKGVQNGQQIHEENFNILDRKGNANQSNNGISPHTSQNDYHQ